MDEQEALQRIKRETLKKEIANYRRKIDDNNKHIKSIRENSEFLRTVIDELEEELRNG